MRQLAPCSSLLAPRSLLFSNGVNLFKLAHSQKLAVRTGTYAKYEKGDCKPNNIPSECNYPTKQGCMDVTYDWLISSTMALIQVRKTCSVLLAPCSLLLAPCSLLLAPCSLLLSNGVNLSAC